LYTFTLHLSPPTLSAAKLHLRCLLYGAFTYLLLGCEKYPHDPITLFSIRRLKDDEEQVTEYHPLFEVFLASEQTLPLTPPPWPAARRKLPAGFFSFVPLVLCVCEQQKTAHRKIHEVDWPIRQAKLKRLSVTWACHEPQS